MKGSYPSDLLRVSERAFGEKRKRIKVKKSFFREIFRHFSSFVPFSSAATLPPSHFWILFISKMKTDHNREMAQRRWCWRRRCCQVTAISRHRPIEWKQSATVSFSNEWELYESCWQRERGVGIRERESTIYTEREDRKSLARRWQGPLKKCRPFCFNVFVVSLDQTKD